MASQRIIIIGGGFGGVACAKTLRKKLSPDQCEIVIFNRENHMVFHPLLAEVAGASINQDAVAVPLRQTLPSVHCRTENVEKIDLPASSVEFESHDGQIRRMAYDHAVIACGRVANIGKVPGMAEHALPLKTVGDAMVLRAHLMQQLEKAEVCEDPERKRWYLSFIIIGGGYSGVEIAGEIQDLVRGSRRFFRNISADDISVKIVQSQDQLLPEISPPLREFARSKLEHAGIDVILNTRVTTATPEGARLGDGRAMNGATVVCTIGTSMAPVLERLDVAKERDRLQTDPDMRLCGFTNAWAIGDCAWTMNAYDNQVCAPTGQFAERQGRQVAENIVRVLHDQNTQPFRFKPLGQLCSIGGHKAVAEILGIRVSGLIAWLLWRTVYLFKLPSWSRRTKVGFDWAWEFIFSRDLSHLKTDHTTSVTRAYYQPGDYIFRQGDLGRGFYIIEKGQVEVLRSEGEEEPAAPVAMLKEGDFFGEMALIESQPRSASVRAHTPVEVVVMGQNVFSQLSRSLTPLRHILIDTIKRRKTEDDHRLAVALGLSIPLEDIGEIVDLGLSIRPPRKSEDIDPTPPPKDDLES